MHIKPSNDRAKEEIREHFIRLKESHDGHDEELRMKVTYKTTEHYIIVDHTKEMPFILKPSTFWTFTFLGLSLIFRILRSFMVSEVTFKIQKCVYTFKRPTVQEISFVHIPLSQDVFPNFNFCKKSDYICTLHVNNPDYRTHQVT